LGIAKYLVTWILSIVTAQPPFGDMTQNESTAERLRVMDNRGATVRWHNDGLVQLSGLSKGFSKQCKRTGHQWRSIMAQLLVAIGFDSVVIQDPGQRAAILSVLSMFIVLDSLLTRRHFSEADLNDLGNLLYRFNSRLKDCFLDLSPSAFRFLKFAAMQPSNVIAHIRQHGNLIGTSMQGPESAHGKIAKREWKSISKNTGLMDLVDKTWERQVFNSVDRMQYHQTAALPRGLQLNSTGVQDFGAARGAYLLSAPEEAAFLEGIFDLFDTLVEPEDAITTVEEQLQVLSALYCVETVTRTYGGELKHTLHAAPRANAFDFVEKDRNLLPSISTAEPVQLWMLLKVNVSRLPQRFRLVLQLDEEQDGDAMERHIYIARSLQQIDLASLDGGDRLQEFAAINELFVEVYRYSESINVGWVDQLGNKLRLLAAFHQGMASTNYGIDLGSNRLNQSKRAAVDPVYMEPFNGFRSHNVTPVMPNAGVNAAAGQNADQQYKETMRNNYGLLLCRTPGLSSLDEAVQFRL
jgi:hypothetical protein